MREYKFRAWDKKRKEWVHKEACSILGETILLCAWMQRPDGHHVKIEELNDIEVIQYTGLKDSKCIEIYESDVVKNSLNDILEIVWNEDRCCFQMQGRYENSYKQRQLDCDIVIDLNIEVIGNIFQNPELIK